jgi:hypothetical protein
LGLALPKVGTSVFFRCLGDLLEKCHDDEHRDIQSTLDCCAAARGALCNRFDGRERPDHSERPNL